MEDPITAARRLVDAASDETDDAVIREQLHSVDQGLAAVDDEPDDAVKGDRLEEIEAKLVGLGDEIDDETAHQYVADARDHLDAYRRERARDWEE